MKREEIKSIELELEVAKKIEIKNTYEIRSGK